MKEALTIYKLIILYTLNKVDSPLTLGLISDYIIDRGYTNYFNVQNAFAELMDAELISASQTYNTSHYSITEEGRQTLELFQNQLSHEIRGEIEQYLRENKQSIAKRMNVVSDYTRSENGEYLVTCSLIENGHVLLETKISIPSEEDAIKICDNWRTNSDELYSLTIKTLLQSP
nr:DUF4364 family protein [Eubacterium sp.]